LKNPLYIAVDLGAGSGRVFLGSLAPGEFSIEEIRRFSYPPAVSRGHLRWNFKAILDNVRAGISDAGLRATTLNRSVASVGVDSWGVDFAFIDAQGQLVEDPVCYRDLRTNGIMEQVFDRIPRSEIFNRTGIQFLQFNTIFQLAAAAQLGLPSNADMLLMIPDLVNHALTGTAVTEFTNATTTQLLNARTRTWDTEILDSLDIPAGLLPGIVSTGTRLGVLRPGPGCASPLRGMQVVAPGTHDTASAVAGAPLKKDWAYISSGTWSLVGVELKSTLINDDVAKENFTNEGGVFGTNRFLKNVMGLWLLEACRKEWLSQGHDAAHESLLRTTSEFRPGGPLIYPDDPRFLNPPSMLEAIAAQIEETDQTMPRTPAEMTACILQSLALRYASVVRTIERLTSASVHGIQIVGGGSQNSYLNQAAATASGKVVAAGPVEATVIGNLVAQTVASGAFETMDAARAQVGDSVELRHYEPQPSAEWNDALGRYQAIESRVTV
jgi:rhamnulokinase